MTSVYLAATYARQAEMRGLRTELQARGVTVTSRWLDQPENDPLTRDEVAARPEYARGCAQRDLEDIEQADVLAVFTSLPSSTGGFHIETGYALGRHKNVLLLGPRLNIFHCLDQVEQVTLPGLVERLISARKV